MEKTLRDLLIDELHDLLSCEEQIVKALPDMVKAAESPDLKKAFEGHLKETKGQVQRLQKIFKLLKTEKKEKFCSATKGLIEECKGVLKDFKSKSPVRDAALISKAQRIEHYEIAAYGTVRTFANELGLRDVAKLLQETLDEEGNANKKLNKIAEGGFLFSGINHEANLSEEDDAPELIKPRSKSKKSSSHNNSNVLDIITSIPKKIKDLSKVATQPKKASPRKASTAKKASPAKKTAPTKNDTQAKKTAPTKNDTQAKKPAPTKNDTHAKKTKSKNSNDSESKKSNESHQTTAPKKNKSGTSKS